MQALNALETGRFPTATFVLTQPIDPPGWIDPAFAARVGMAERLAAWSAPRTSAHPLRPEAHGLLSTNFWPILFPLWDPGVTGVPIEQRHPYLDLRLVRLALSIPPAQWYNDKGLLRIGMRGRLPEAAPEEPEPPPDPPATAGGGRGGQPDHHQLRGGGGGSRGARA